MIVRNSDTAMPVDQHNSRVDTLELKSQIERKLGRVKAEKYFNLLARYLSVKISKSEFDRLCIGTIGRENIRLHNHLLRSLIKNASLSKTPPPKDNKVEGSSSVKVANGYHRSSLQSLCKDFPQSPRKGRTPSLRDRKFKDRPSPLGPHGKSCSTVCEDGIPKTQEQQSATELFSLGSKPPCSVEDGEEVDQAAGSPSIHSRSPVRAPLGVSLSLKSLRKPCSMLSSDYYTETCHYKGELPDTSSLRKRLEQSLNVEGMKTTVECVSLLNSSLDVFLKRLIRPCLELASSRSGIRLSDKGQNNGRLAHNTTGSISASMLDFQVATQLNPLNFGEDWPSKLEKICLLAAEKVSEMDYS